MSNIRIVRLVILLLSAVALVAVTRKSSSAEVLGAGLPGAAEPSAHPASVIGARVSVALSPPERVAARGTKIEPLSPGHASTAGVGDRDAYDPPQDANEGAAETASAASLEELREFRAFVSTSLSEIRHEEVAAQLANLEQQAANMGLTVQQLARSLDLTATQARKMESVLLSRLDVEAEYWRQWGQGADGEILGELKARDRAAHIDELSRFLTPEQLKDYLSR